jgi:hypothetical protein
MCQPDRHKLLQSHSFGGRVQVMLLTKRRLLSVAGLLALFLVAGCLAYVFSLPKPNRNITTATYAQIQMGMSEAEVEKILGGPAGDYLTAPEPHDSDFELFAKRFTDLSSNHKRWKADELCVFLDFDEDGLVRVKHCLHSTPRPANIFQTLRRLLAW